ncbi:PRA1 family protein B4-like, partial [Cynara cardunculus var. scolymus]|uniref:PRA1 family protein B4-like n=1 Tax=Cynara cardunculus var. scolymus TaxID=59895 RepID=UPI000D628A32
LAKRIKRHELKQRHINLISYISLVILLGLLAAWLFLYLFRPSDPSLVIFGRTFSECETLGLLIVSGIVAIFLTSVESVLISALLLGTAVVSAHGAFRTPEDLFLDEQESSAFRLNTNKSSSTHKRH